MLKAILACIRIKNKNLRLFFITFWILLFTVSFPRQAWGADYDYTISQKEKEDPKRHVYQDDWSTP
jgi:hypothetical protein